MPYDIDHHHDTRDGLYAGSTGRKTRRVYDYDADFGSEYPKQYLSKHGRRYQVKRFVAMARFDHLAAFPLAMAVIRHLLEEAMVIFFESYLIHDGNRFKQALNALVAEYIAYCRDGIDGLPTFDIRQFNKSLPLGEILRGNFWTRKEKTKLKELCTKYADPLLRHKDVIDAVVSDFRDGTGRRRTRSAITKKIVVLHLLPSGIVLKPNSSSDVAEGRRIAEILVQRNPSLIPTKLLPRLIADLETTRPGISYSEQALLTYLGRARTAAGLVHVKNNPNPPFIMSALSEVPIKRVGSAIRQLRTMKRLPPIENCNTLQQLQSLQQYVNAITTKKPDVGMLRKALLKHLAMS